MIFYNIKGGKQVSYMEMIDSTGGGEPVAEEQAQSKVRISSAVAHHEKTVKTRINTGLFSAYAGFLFAF